MIKRHRLVKEKSNPFMIIILCCCICLSLAWFFPARAMERPRPGEIQQLRDAGEFESRLEYAYQVGNHKVDPYLIQKLKEKMLAIQGKSIMAPPPARQGMPSIGTVRTFALLIEFQDYTHSVSETTVDDMLYGTGNPANFPRESLTSWYDRSSYGLLDLSNGATLGWYQTGYDRSAVVEDATGRENLIKEALNHFNTIGHDFSQYDNNSDGIIDYFIVLWTGPDTGWGNFWWGYQHTWNDIFYLLDGKWLRKYSWQWESDHPGVVIHETGHGLGLPDYYDYDDTVGPDGGVGGFDIMDGVWDHNCFSKWMLEWLTPTVVSGGTQDLTLNPTATHPEAVLIWPGISSGDIYSPEYFMVQNRGDVQNDDDGGFDVDGLAIWHIAPFVNPITNDFFFDNSYTVFKLIRLMEADGLEEIETAQCIGGFCSNHPTWTCDVDGNCQVADAGDFYTTGDVISHISIPSSRSYTGTDSCVTVCDVQDLGTQISATFSMVCSQPPTADADGPYAADCQGIITTLQLDGTGSFDPDPDDTLTYLWTTDCPGASFDDPGSQTPVLAVDTSPGCSVNCSVTLTVEDCIGNLDSDSSPVTISDNLLPDIFIPADITIECDEPSDPSNTGSAIATDDCDDDPVVNFSDTIIPGSCPQSWVIIRAWTATDYCGNSSSGDQVITVVDTTPPVINCPSDVTVTCGDPTDPAATGMATATDNCDPAPVVNHADVVTWPTCLADPVMYTITRTWTATDACGNASLCVQTITVLKIVLDLDIKPGSCPNSFNRRSNGVLSVALLGTPGVDVTTIDLSTVLISRVDCVGGGSGPNEGPQGPHSRFKDVGAPYIGDPCDCQTLGKDGIKDLYMKFNSDALATALELDGFLPGDSVELAVTGTLSDGCEFIAIDCIRLVPPGGAGFISGDSASSNPGMERGD